MAHSKGTLMVLHGAKGRGTGDVGEGHRPAMEVHRASHTSTRYLLSTGRIPTGTGMMGPLSMSTGPLMGGRSAFPDGPI